VYAWRCLVALTRFNQEQPRHVIIALDGAPGVGKSTIAAGVAGAAVIPEVNRLFARPDPEPPWWYCERQVARWEMAKRAAAQGRRVLLDGDCYQPLWFSWIYQDDGWPLDAMAFRFFRDKITQGHMGFPDLYVFVHCPEALRRERMIARELSRGHTQERALRKTDRYARMVAPQRRFFAALAERFPGWVLDLETVSLEPCLAVIRNATAVRSPVAATEAFDFIERWLKNPK
jgi:adenylate kinase family enzyme